MDLLHDRYAVIGNRAYDLVDGCIVALEDAAPDPRGHDEGELPALAEVLEHGRDGMPRWVVVEARHAGHAAALGRRAAATARRSGFVSVSVDSFERLRGVLAPALADRALLLVGGAGDAATAVHRGLLAAAALSARPHVLLTFRSQRAPASFPLVVREARAAYGTALPRPGGRPAAAPPEVRAHLERAARAQEFVAEGRHAAAERLLRDVLGSLERRHAYPEAARVALRLAVLLARRSRFDAADAACAEAVRLAGLGADPDMVLRARLQEALLRLPRRRIVEAEALARAVLLASPADGIRLPALRLLALCLLHQSRVREAADLGLDGSDTTLLEPFDAAEVHDAAVRVALAGGHIFGAGAIATRALDAARASGHPEAMFVAFTTQLRVLCAAGAIDAAASCRAQLRLLEVRARLPLYDVEARLAWCEALQRAGRAREAKAERDRLARFRKVAPTLLHDAIDRVLSGESAMPAQESRWSTPAGGAEIVRIAADHDDDGEAVQRVLEHLAAELATSRIEVVSNDGGPITAMVSVGSGLPTTLGRRVMESGIPLGFGVPDGREAATPIRRGSRLIGAVIGRWPADRQIPDRTAAVVELAAAVVAPRLEAMQARSREAAAASVDIPELIGTSAAMEEVRRAIARAARAPFAVLIEGESGTGKELVARAIHQMGARRERRFCDVNCAALPDELLESELFGHARGAFTGALVDRAGLFEAADGGTLFMDEIADLSPRAQAKLLRVVQQQEVRRVGETVSRRIDVRLVAAANRDLQAEADAGRFRPDLLYRLNVIRLRLPPLRDRAADIPALAQHFWREAAARVGSRASLTPAVFAALARYSWPGNVRELQNVVAAVAVAAPTVGRVGPTLLPAIVAGSSVPPAMPLSEARDHFERRYVEGALARAGGSRTRAAASLGITRQGLLKTMARLGIR